MSTNTNNSKFKVAVGALLLLISMQFAAIAHASEHTLNSTDQVCITHIDLSQFSNVIPSDAIVLPLSTQLFEHHTFIEHANFPTLSIHYLSRAPPLFE